MTFEEKVESYNQQIDQTSSWILSQMKIANDKWEMPWHKGIPQSMNAKTGKFYGGNNQMILWRMCLEKGYSRNKWATLYQWSSVKAKLRRGEKGTLICIAIPKLVALEKRKGQLDLFDVYDPKEIKTSNKYFSFRFRYVFNQAQVNNYFGDQPDIFNPAPDPDNLIKTLIIKSEAEIRHGGERAFYRPSEDFIQMPELARFRGERLSHAEDRYYSVLLHELIHWTGHNLRCKRGFGKFGSKGYALEELVAELGSALLSTHLNRKIYPREDHAQYLNNWLTVLENDFTYFNEALDMAKYSIYWLFKETGVYPFDLKKQEPKIITEKRLEKWEKEGS
jgi:antirestriction protein ArdC